VTSISLNIHIYPVKTEQIKYIDTFAKKKHMAVLTVNAPSISRRNDNKGTEAAGASKRGSKLEDEAPSRRCINILLQTSWRLPPAKRAHGVHEMQRPTPKQREQGATHKRNIPKTEAPEEKQPREAALERTRPPPAERLLQKSGRESLTSRTLL